MAARKRRWRKSSENISGVIESVKVAAENENQQQPLASA